MAYGKLNADGTLSSANTQIEDDFVSLSNFETDVNGDFFEVYNLTPASNGKFSQNSTKNAQANLLAETLTWKQHRTQLVAEIEVTFNGSIYQGDEISQARMSRAIHVLPDDTTQIPWVAKDNSVVMLNRLNLKSILLLAATEQSRIWNLDRPS